MSNGQELYHDLHASRERLCRAQQRLGGTAHAQLLQEAIDNIDRVGVTLPNWSRHDLPPLPPADQQEER
jgi:hypothetical protein